MSPFCPCSSKSFQTIISPFLFSRITRVSLLLMLLLICSNIQSVVNVVCFIRLIRCNRFYACLSDSYDYSSFGENHTFLTYFLLLTAICWYFPTIYSLYTRAIFPDFCAIYFRYFLTKHCADMFRREPATCIIRVIFSIFLAV